MLKYTCQTLRFLATTLVCTIAAGSATAKMSAVHPANEAFSTTVTPALVERVKAVLPQCKFGYRSTEAGLVAISPDLLVPSVEAMSRKSAPELTKEEAGDLYQIAIRMMQPALSSTEGILDALRKDYCPSLPEDAATIFEYLISHGPDEYRGPSNSLIWLARAYESGAVGQPDTEKARSYHLRWAIHSRSASAEYWSDGIDDDLISNIERGGLRPYLEGLARADHSIGVGSARIILAQEAIDSNRQRARELLMYPFYPGLKLLLQYEEEGRLSIPETQDDIAFWAGLRYGFRDQLARERMLKGVELFNDGPIPTQATQPAPATLDPYTSLKGLYRPRAIEEPVAIRVLVDTEGRAIHGQACQATPDKRIVKKARIRELTYAVQAYNVSTLPSFPVYRSSGRAQYSWVTLPAMTFEEDEEGVLTPKLTQSPVERCQFVATPKEFIIEPPPFEPRR